MASRKKELVRRAKALGVDHIGTIAELERRIDRAREERTSFTHDESEEEPEIELESEFEPEPEPTVEPKPELPPKKVEPAPRAHPVENFGDLQTRIALKTTVKFIGRWYTLRRDKPLTAPGNVIKSLERAGLVEKN
jgi:hypothetical protein